MSAAQTIRMAQQARASRQAGVSVLLGAAFVAVALGVSAVQVASLRQDRGRLERSVSDLEQRKDMLATQNTALEQTLAQRRQEIQTLEQHKALLLQSMKELSPAPVKPTRVPDKAPAQKRALAPSGRGSGLGSVENALPEAGQGGAIERPAAPSGPPLVSPGMARASAEERADAAASGKKLYDFSVWLDLPAALRPRIRQVSYTFDHPTFAHKEQRSTDAGSGFRAGYTGWGCLSTVAVEVQYRDATPSDRFSFDQCAAIVARGDSAKK